MFHCFVGKRYQYKNSIYLQNEFFGIEVSYLGTQSEGMFFIYPHLDDKKKTIFYFAFDTSEQKELFEHMIKINGIGTKTAFQMVQISQKDLENAITSMDIKFFQAIPGIGPKTAKKIILELKENFDFKDIQNMDIDQKLYKDIVKSLKGFGYDSDKVKTILQTYPSKITKSNITEVIKRVIGNM